MEGDGIIGAGAAAGAEADDAVGEVVVAALEDDGEEDAGDATAGVEVVVPDVVAGVVKVDDEVAGGGELPDLVGAAAAIDGEDETTTDAGSLDAAVVCEEDELPPP